MSAGRPSPSAAGGHPGEGDPSFGLTARRWTTAELDPARHRPDLVPGERVQVNLDLAQHGIGTASCGPGVLPPYRLDPATGQLRGAAAPPALTLA